MSELKVIDLGNIRESIENNESVYYEYYAKSEADKVIADLEEKHKKEVGQLLIEIAELKDIDSKNRSAYYKDLAMMAKDVEHQKYKRCLAMAQEWRSYATFCGMQSSCHNHRGFGKTAEKYSWKECHAWKCVKRWLAIAKKFKEAK